MVCSVAQKPGRKQELPGLSADLSRRIRMVKSNLKQFNLAGVNPIPVVRKPRDTVKTYHFKITSPGMQLDYEVCDTGTTRASKVPLADAECVYRGHELIVAETPMILEGSAASCAIVSLYDTRRKVGALMHLFYSQVFGAVERGMISLALYQMGVLKGGHLNRVEAKILGIAEMKRLGTTSWFEGIRGFLKDCSVRILPDEVEREVDVKLHLLSGRVEAYDELYCGIDEDTY